MKIDFFDLFKVLNDIYLIRQMSIAERVLVRPKKDLINYIAIHLWSIIKTILIFSVLFILIDRPELVPIDIFYVYIIIGTAFLVFDIVGFKALAFLIKKFYIMLFDIHKKLLAEIKKYFSNLTGVFENKKFLIKFLYLMINFLVFILVFPIFYFINLLILVLIYSFIIAIIIFFLNETLSLIITYTFCKMMQSIISFDNIIYALYSISFIVIYYIIDYRVRLTNGTMVLEQSVDSGNSLVVGLPLLNISGKLSVFQKDKKFYVFDNDTNGLKIYSVHSKFNDLKSIIEHLFIKRNENKLTQFVSANESIENKIKKIDFNDEVFKGYEPKKFDIFELEKSDSEYKKEYKRSKLESMNIKFSKGKEHIDNFKGIYIFASTENISLQESFFQVVELYSKCGDVYTYERSGASEYMLAKREDRHYPIDIGDNEIIYIGKSADVFGRTRDHLTSNIHNGNMSLKLGFESRTEIKKHMVCYIILVENEDERRQLEKKIRNNFGSYFGIK